MASKPAKLSGEDKVLIAVSAVLFLCLAGILVVSASLILKKEFSVRAVLTSLAMAGLLSPFLYALYALIMGRLRGRPVGSAAALSRRFIPARSELERDRLRAGPKLELSARSEKAAMRCVYCHDGFDTRPVTLCPCCEARLHPECWTEVGACPTIGCEASRPKDRSRGQSEKQRG